MPPESHAADDFGGRLDDRIISLRGIKNASDGPPFEPNHDREEKEQEAGYGGKIAGIKRIVQNATNANNSITSVANSLLIILNLPFCVSTPACPASP